MRKVSLVRLFWEFFKIALFVIGGGYAIAAVAEDVFGRRRKWLAEGEILDHMPIVSAVPGLIAGNIAVYTGLKLRGRLGAVVALCGVALPSFLIFLAVSAGLSHVPHGQPVLEGAFLGLRSALTGVVAAMMWKMIVRGPIDWSKGVGVELTPLSRRTRFLALAVFAAAVTFAAVLCRQALAVFLVFGCLCIGGGFPLMPFYRLVFVGTGAWLIGLPEEDFSNLIALTQLTPGPVGVNAATYFGYRLGGVFGAAIATAALLTPSYFLMTAVLTGLNRWRTNVVLHRVVGGLKVVALVLMGIACWGFAGMSLWRIGEEGSVTFSPLAIALAALVCFLQIRRKLPIMLLICASAFVGALVSVLI